MITWKAAELASGPLCPTDCAPAEDVLGMPVSACWPGLAWLKLDCRFRTPGCTGGLCRPGELPYCCAGWPNPCEPAWLKVAGGGVGVRGCSPLLLGGRACGWG